MDNQDFANFKNRELPVYVNKLVNLEKQKRKSLTQITKLDAQVQASASQSRKSGAQFIIRVLPQLRDLGTQISDLDVQIQEYLKFVQFVALICALRQ